MKIKVFSGMTEKALAKKVNYFLNDQTIEVVDIKFSAEFFYMGVMVIYKIRD